MGYSRWSSDTYSQMQSTYSQQSRSAIFRSTNIHPDLDPRGLVVRESRDSAAHPNALAIGVFLDVTGSMGRIPEMLIRHKLGSLMDTLIDHGIEDPQVMFSAIGDHISDRAPLQVGQFESGTEEMNDCLSKIFLEGGGGGQSKESYALAWLIGGRHTSIDCYEKRRKKGFLFTIGDEMNWDTVDARRLSSIMGYREAGSMDARQVLREAQEKYHVFHIHINETGYRNNTMVMEYWRNLLGERFLVLDNHQALAELIASTVALVSGVDPDRLLQAFDPSTADMVQNALGDMSIPKRPDSGRRIFRF
ncbi:hypothetical protein [Flavilitoribacter nigricans]|uniref:VWA domain-containing protein n=1 Tax=Flavilitoribacter nigricans (strain ATCC 23147 / DSM 23189 / NBRC 102662 / NCIMB 1420 / SS-2) TaxID=1122177 RepID=A0A2D0N8I2_FLAN2|nr:hypothetical protein [Flavilitoribacter nigricans]PHN04698.1 hypothetical protein CRP01_19470 [Flavilitoribacter nigricans DSM 23189 = NBRC 102662]